MITKANPGVKDLSRPGIEPQSHYPHPAVIAFSYANSLLFDHTKKIHLKALNKLVLDLDQGKIVDIIY